MTVKNGASMFRACVRVVTEKLSGQHLGMLLPSIPWTLKQQQQIEIVLVEGSRVFESWKNPPPPVYMEYFFFNITNVDEVLLGAKPKVQQVGPYTYREYRYKDNVSMVENGTMVSAYNTKSFVFLREKSVGDPAVDIITTVNIPGWAVMNKVKGNFFKSLMVNAMGVEVFTNRTVQGLLWGYEDALLTKVSASQPDVETTFGLMYKKNGSNDGEFVYHTGVNDYMDYGRVETWKGESQLTFWKSDHSNSINGSDGSAFHPLLDKKERIYIFTPDLCRTIYMDFEKDVKVKGIPAYRFTPPRSVLASKVENPDNAGFCVTPQECLGTGLLKVSPCRKGAPVVASFPHFYLGEDKFAEAIDGMSPQREHHQTFLDLNPTTGIIVRANKRAQINILLQRITGFPKTKNLKETIFPVMFLNESVEIDDNSAARVQKLLLISNLVSNFPLFIVGLGVIMLLILIVLLVKARRQKNEVKTKPRTAQTSAEDDTSYSPVSNKDKDDPQNGAYIGLTSKSEQQA
uniref:Lysosome membrane protein 2-like n=1 Tax=Cynoglossus semilaevis TaxID=244447 RepID=A0A3P8UKS2_CYNSE